MRGKKFLTKGVRLSFQRNISFSERVNYLTAGWHYIQFAVTSTVLFLMIYKKYLRQRYCLRYVKFILFKVLVKKNSTLRWFFPTLRVIYEAIPQRLKKLNFQITTSGTFTLLLSDEMQMLLFYMVTLTYVFQINCYLEKMLQTSGSSWFLVTKWLRFFSLLLLLWS